MTGYLFQVRYALLRALDEGRRNPSHMLSIEKFDDVAFEESGEAVELIQTKHHGRPGNTSDSSVDLWKTLHIWIKRIESDPVAAADTRFVFLTTNSAAEGSALARLRETQNERDEVDALNLLHSAANMSNNQVTKNARTAFLELDTTIKQLLVGNIWVFDNAPNIIDVREEIERQLHYSAPGGRVDAFTDHLEGWWFSRVIMALNQTEPSSIPLTVVQNKVFEIGEGFRLGNLPLDDAIDAMPPAMTLPADNRVFVRQMDLVGVSGDEQLTAVHDFYRASAQRSRWAREDLLLDGETDRYDRGLTDEWRRRFVACVGDTPDDSDDATKQARGKRIFRWACQYHRPLRNRDEIWLSAGSFQILADRMLVGWHPGYRELLSSGEDHT